MRSSSDTEKSYECYCREFIQRDAPEISMDDIYDSDVSFTVDRKYYARFNKHDPVFDQEAFDRTAEKIISRMKSKRSNSISQSRSDSLPRAPLFERPDPSMRPIPQLSPIKRLFAKPTVDPVNASQISIRSPENKKYNQKKEKNEQK